MSLTSLDDEWTCFIPAHGGPNLSCHSQSWPFAILSTLCLGVSDTVLTVPLLCLLRLVLLLLVTLETNFWTAAPPAAARHKKPYESYSTPLAGFSLSGEKVLGMFAPTPSSPTHSNSHLPALCPHTGWLVFAVSNSPGWSQFQGSTSSRNPHRTFFLFLPIFFWDATSSWALKYYYKSQTSGPASDV